MVTRSRIEWTSSTWNPVTGCNPVSAGCEHCYAERMARRLQGMGVPKYRYGFKLTLHPDVVEDPLKWKKPRVIFTTSMSDLFHPDIPLEYLRGVFDVMRRADWHVFQVLTKRSKRLATLAPKLPWPDNVWMGVTVENEHYQYRIDHLRRVPAHVRFLSMEPLLGPVRDLNLENIHWVIVGGESGPGARPMHKDWVVDIRRECKRQGAAFFFKQWGGVNKKQTGRLLDGRTWDDMPALPAEAQKQLVLL